MILTNLDKNKIIHMVGIGGTSMSGIAEILVNMGYKVTGSNICTSVTTEKLENNGIKIIYGHFAENVEDAGLVIYTAAIKNDNPELVHANELGIPTIERAEFLGELTKLYNNTISICGTHGKTTTTSMISLCFVDGKKDPTIQVGAEIKQIGNQNYRIGESENFIVESCEYVRSFLKFHPHSAVLLNIEEDHLDYYKDLDDIKSAFLDFVSLVPTNGYVVYNADDTNCIDVCKDLTSNKVTFGIKNESADFVATNISLMNNGAYEFDVNYDNQSEHIKLNVFGYHNIYNALATIAICIKNNIDIYTIKETLAKYSGAGRRFEYVGTVNGARIYDDYAHHPTEVKAVISAANKIPHNKLWVVFQPHTYTRTHALFNDFASAFVDADTVILTDIYAAREKDTGLVSSEQLAKSINEISKNCTFIKELTDVEKYILEHVKENDIVLTLGAGTVTDVGRNILLGTRI